jgi:hypothetical protein
LRHVSADPPGDRGRRSSDAPRPVARPVEPGKRLVSSRELVLRIERIRGGLLELGDQVSKRTIEKYMRGVRGRSGGGQSWAIFVKNHAERM